VRASHPRKFTSVETPYDQVHFKRQPYRPGRLDLRSQLAVTRRAEESPLRGEVASHEPHKTSLSPKVLPAQVGVAGARIKNPCSLLESRR
jgi:hypothetical protein